FWETEGSQSYRVDHKKAQMQGWISKESIKHTPSPLCLSVSTAYVGLPRLQTERQGGKMEWKWEEGGKMECESQRAVMRDEEVW
uniref:Uncharacterized protein n=1 Tax=Neolamprologus brichardi TaxID=32507 RepID=A0A3Q4H5Y7_NEOBR